jgi:hypothetical protein
METDNHQENANKNKEHKTEAEEKHCGPHKENSEESPHLEINFTPPWRFIFDIIRRKHPSINKIDATGWFTGVLCIFTFALAWIAFLQYGTLEKTDSTLKSQLLAMENDQRPWLRPKISKLYPLILDGKTVNFGFEYTIVNSGKTPAIYAESQFDFEPGFGKAEQQDALCRHADIWLNITKSPLTKRTIFPNEDGNVHISFYSNNEMTYDYGSDRMPFLFIPDRDFVMQIFGCIAYRSTLNDTIRHTRVAWMIWKTRDGNTIDWKFPKTIQGDDIALRYSTTGFNTAD